MVQYVIEPKHLKSAPARWRSNWRYFGNPSYKVKPQDFWKLISHELHTSASIKDFLRNQGYPVTPNGNKDKIVRQHMRHQRGLVNYDTCSVAELQKFCSQRKIMSKPGARDSLKFQLVEKLDNADDGEIFNKFLDLPAELRVRVYKMHFGSLVEDPEDVPAPYPVPITEVCSLIRHESLPVYYNTYTFKLKVPHDGLPFSLGSSGQWDDMLRFVVSGADTQLAMLKHIFIVGEMKQPDNFDYDTYGAMFPDDDPNLHCRIDLGTDYKPGTVLFERNTNTNDHEEDESQRRLSLLRDILDRIDRRPGGKKLLRADIRDMASVISDALDPPSKAWLINEDEEDESDEDDEDTDHEPSSETEDEENAENAENAVWASATARHVMRQIQ